MLISKKKNNNQLSQILVILLGFVCCIALVGCTKSSLPANNDKEQIPASKTMDEATLRQLENIVGQRIEASKPILLYQLNDGKMEVKGELQPHQMVLLDSVEIVNSIYLPIAGTNWMIDGTQVEKSGYTRKLENHLIPYNETVTTTDSFELKTEEGNVVLRSDEATEFAVYVKEENRTGILFQERIFYLDNTQIATQKENQNTQMKAASDIPVLMYHFFYDEAQDEVRKDVNYVEVKEFKEQLDTLKENDYVSLTMKELYLVLSGIAQAPEKSFVMTIDDGDPSVYTYAYPLIKESGYNATLFLITGWLPGQMPFSFIEMREDGLELQSHSFLMHQGGCKGMGHGGRLLCTDEQTGVDDTIASLEYVDGGFVYCYPFGDVNDNAIKILKESGVLLAFTTEYGKVHAGSDLYRLPRIRVTGGAGIDRFMNGLN